MRQATLLFLLKNDESGVRHICLALKRRKFGVGKLNGVGGKVEEGESVHEAARREAKEEIGVDVLDMEKVAELHFMYESHPENDQHVHVYVSKAWDGDPSLSEEMEPFWFPVSEIPFDRMWEDDVLWLPRVLTGEHLFGTFTFDPNYKLLKHSLKTGF